MIAMDIKGITWVGNIYQKFENMCLEVEDTMFEDTVKYIENQMQTVGESVKKIYSDVLQDFRPPSSCDLDENLASELPIDQYTDAGFCRKSFQGSEKVTVRDDTKQTSKESRINHDVNNDVIHAASALFLSASGNSVKGNKNNFISHATHYFGSADIKSILGSDENQQDKKMPATKTLCEITLSKTDTCRTSQSCEVSNENKNHEVTLSKPASPEVTSLASVAGCCNEIEHASTEQIPNVLLLVKSAEEKEMTMSSSSSSVLFGDPDGFSTVRRIQSDDCSYSTIVVSHPETWSLNAMKIDTVREQGHKNVQQDDELKLEETCVMVAGDELQLVPKAGSNLRTSKKKRRQPFSLSKKSARKQEYEELAIWHGNNEKGNGDSVENLCPASMEDQKKLLLPDISESEWELL